MAATWGFRAIGMTTPQNGVFVGKNASLRVNSERFSGIEAWDQRLAQVRPEFHV
jgi:hypothetical protein